jgi:hypothetical protein
VREGGRVGASEPEGFSLVKARRSICAARFGTAALLAGSCVAAAAATVALVGVQPASATPSDILIAGTHYGLNAIDCMSASDCLVIAGNEATGGDASYANIENGKDGGVESFPGEATIYAMACPSPGICFAVGNTGVHPDNPPDYEDGAVVPIIYGEVEPPILVPGTSFLTGIACPPGTTQPVHAGGEPTRWWAEHEPAEDPAEPSAGLQRPPDGAVSPLTPRPVHPPGGLLDVVEGHPVLVEKLLAKELPRLCTLAVAEFPCCPRRRGRAKAAIPVEDEHGIPAGSFDL